MKKSIIMIVIAIVIIVIGSVIIVKNNQNKKQIVKPFYLFVATIDESDELYKDKVIQTYDEYNELLEHYQAQSTIDESDFEKYEYLSIIIENNYCNGSIEGIESADINKDTVDVLVNIKSSCGVCAPIKLLYFIRFEKGKLQSDIKTNIKYRQINNVKCDPDTEYKPVIYLYPTVDTDVTVKLGKEENLLVTYPKYEKEWKVRATKQGNLTDENGRNYYALYWEGISYSIKNSDEGFVVKGEDTIEFLEEKLKILGLNERESNEFIMYWLPKLQNNEYNYIRFASMEEINDSMPLIINPKPDTIIRILMISKPLKEKISVKEQKLITPNRKGFTVVEWGGTTK